MRDRLMKLLCGVECNGEETLGNCPQRRDGKCRTVQKLEMCQIGAIAEHLLANGIIVPQCKVGDTVYSFIQGIPVIYEGRVYEIIHNGHVCFYRGTRKGYFTQAFSEDDIGKTVFLTREEAEQALKGDTTND